MSEQQPRSRFPATFWVANVMELFERAAYYGMNSVLAVYLTGAVADGGLGFSEQEVGFLQSIVYAATYVLPILGGALADRYGYRRMLLVAFSLMPAATSPRARVAVRPRLPGPARDGHRLGPLQAHHLGHDRAHHRRVELGLRLRHLLLDDQPRGVPCPARRERAQGFSWQYVFAASSPTRG